MLPAVRRHPWVPCQGYGKIASVLLAAVLAGCTGQTIPPGLTAGPGSSVVCNSAAPFTVGVIPTRAPRTRFGHKLAFRLNTSTCAYRQLYLLTASGDVLVLTQNLPLDADTETVYPDPDTGLVLRASPPAVEERLLFLVTIQPFEGFGKVSATGTPLQLAMRVDAFIRDLNAATHHLPEAGWAVK